MALLDVKGGCKVGWAWFDDEEEAKRCAAQESEARERMFRQGYDLGYLWPGSAPELVEHPEHGQCWKVITT